MDFAPEWIAAGTIVAATLGWLAYGFYDALEQMDKRAPESTEFDRAMRDWTRIVRQADIGRAISRRQK